MSTLTCTFRITHVPEQTFAYVVRRVAPEEAGEFISGAIDRVHGFAIAHGGPQGPPMTISSPPDETGALVLEVGWPVPTGTRAVAPIEVRTLPPTAAIAHLHAGPYDELRGLYRGLYARAREAGYTPGAAPRERYLTAPGDGTPVTEVIWPIA